MKKILIVEDDHNLGIMVKDILQFDGHEVILSRKPEDTVENIQNNDIALVVIDKLMSGVDGTDICTEIRNTETISEIPVLMMSALANARASCMEAGATDFIPKPFDIKDLLSKIKSLLNS